MHINFKAMLVGLALPVSLIGSTTFKAAFVEPKSAQVATLPYVIDVYSADGSLTEKLTGQSNKPDVFEIADDLGAKPDWLDKFSAFPNVNMGIGSEIAIYQVPKYTVEDGKRTTTVKSWTKTVGDLLAEQKIELGDDDKINFPISTSLEPNMQIDITRVAITNIDKSVNIAFKIVNKNDNTLDKGKTRIAQQGQSGTQVLTYRVRREDGIEVSRTLIGTKTTVSPVDQIVMIGTKPVITGWCAYNSTVMGAAIKYGIDPDKICALMHKESNGHADSSGQGGAHLGLFQYDPGFWADASAKAGYSGASIYDPTAQIYTTAWALTHGYQNRW